MRLNGGWISGCMGLAGGPMGTVGLSFGSPTSGTGINVSSTVAEIVSNLDNVETPWNNQLTSLESQDTVISNLGSLMSNVSNDISSLTDLQGVMAQMEGSSSDTSVLELTTASSSAVAGTYTVVVSGLATTANGYLDPITNASDTLTGSISINGATVDVPDSSTGDDTLSGLVSAINNADIGVTASVTTDANGSRLSLESNTSGAGGSLDVTSSVTDSTTSTALGYNSNLATGANATLSVNGVNYQVASNTVSNLIPGVTFQLLGTTASGSQVQVVIATDNSGVESAVNQFVSDYNSLISAVNAQEGDTSSGTPEPLFGSPTLSLLQQELLSSLDSDNPNGYLASVAAGSDVTLSGSMTIQVGSGTTETIQIGAAPSGGGDANTIYTGTGSDYNTLAGLAAAINAAGSSTPVDYTSASGGESGAMTASTSAQLSGTLTLQAADGTEETIYLGPSSDAPTGDLATGTSDNTLDSLASFIAGNSTLSNLGISASSSDSGGTSTMTLTSSNGALTVTSGVVIPGLGVTAAISTSNGESTLGLNSQTTGSGGALTVTSAIVASTPSALSYTGAGSTTAASGTLGSVASSTDSLSGSLTVQADGGAAQTINMSDVDSAENGTTLADLESYINDPSNGFAFSASLNSAGTALTLASSAGGSLAVTSNLYDTTDAAASTLAYTNSSDINSITTLGISVNNDGSLTFDANSLDSVLNSDYSSVVSFFQNADSWGMSFSNMLTNAGSSSSGLLGLAASSNSSTESTLEAKVSNENSLISSETSSLTTELNTANQTLQQIPAELDEINELYSAITGYNEQTNG